MPKPDPGAAAARPGQVPPWGGHRNLSMPMKQPAENESTPATTASPSIHLPMLALAWIMPRR